MNVFGTTTDDERRKALTRIEKTNEILATKITTLFNNETDIRSQLQDIISRQTDFQTKLNHINFLNESMSGFRLLIKVYIYLLN